MKRILLGFVIGVILVPIVVLALLRFGKMPVAVADPPFPQERLIAGIPLNARINRELVKKAPIQTDEDGLLAGAQIYSDRCAGCHGLHGKPSSFGSRMFPAAPQLWEKHRNSDVVGVSDDLPGKTFWKVSNGIRLTGMPAYKTVLTEPQMWKVSLLLANADKPLPPSAIEILRGEQPLAPAPAPAPAKKK
jgi:mono/diheme cytochrome c family protein